MGSLDLREPQDRRSPGSSPARLAAAALFIQMTETPPVRYVETLPAGPGAPATARAALTRWLTGQVPGEVLADARLLASELVANSAVTAEPLEEGSLQFAVQLKGGALRVDVRGPAESTDAPAAPAREPGGGLGLQLVEALATRWGADRSGGTHLWFEVDAERRATSSDSRH